MRDDIGLTKVGLYFDCNPDVDREALKTQLREQAERKAADLPDDVAQRAGERITQMPAIPHQRVMANAPKPFDFAYQLSASNPQMQEAMEDAVASMGEALHSSIDRSNTAVLVGREIAITKGDGPIYNIMPLRRLPALDHTTFMNEWFGRHASLGEGVEGVRYRQNHVAHAPTKELADRMGLQFPEMDGLTESYFDSVSAAVAILGRDDVAIDAIDDERRFIDHERSQFALYETIWRN